MAKVVDVKNKLSKAHPKMLHSGKELQLMTVPRFSTGSLVLDLVYGGGIPIGKFSLIHGAKSSGKTTTSLIIANEFLKAFPKKSVVWVDIEQAFDWDWAKNFIDDTNRFHLIIPEYGEMAVDMMCEYMAADDAGLLIPDSLASLVPTAEAEGDASDSFIALQVKLINKIIKKMMPLIGAARRQGSHKTVLFLNQIRANFGARAFGSQTRQPGGRMLEHTVSTDAKFYRKEVKKIGGIPTLSVHSFTMDKNKVGLPKQTGELAYYLRPYKGYKAGDIDEAKTVVKMAKKGGIIAKKGTKWQVGNKTFRTQIEAVNALNSDKELVDAVKAQVLEMFLDNPEAVVDDSEA